MIFLVGGARSGKSGLAASIAWARERPVTIIATARADDPEMQARIERHRRRRPRTWAVVEEPVDVEEALGKAPDDDTIVLDCVTLWISNLMVERQDTAILGRVDDAIAATGRRSGETIVVSNEVGSGVVPMHPVGRRFRDLQGIANQRFAASADAAYLVIAGRILRLERSEDVF